MYVNFLSFSFQSSLYAFFWYLLLNIFSSKVVEETANYEKAMTTLKQETQEFQVASNPEWIRIRIV